MLIPIPKICKETENELFLNKTLYLTVSRAFYDKGQTKLLSELFHNFTSGYCKLKISVKEVDIPSAVLANEPKELKETELSGNEYSLLIDSEKAVLNFSDKKSFAHAFCTLLQLIEVRFDDEGEKVLCTLPVTEIYDSPDIEKRMAHICVFAESDFSRIRRTVREIGFYKYTHLVVEFWGMFPFECNKSLSRKNAFTKRQIACLYEDAKAFGLEIIPMLNIWGHGAMNREIGGKHTSLENNPKMQPYFSACGWEWNIQNPAVLSLHEQMIDELTAAFPEGEYFHIGCDESRSFGDDRSMKNKDRETVVGNYINGINEHIKARGRKTLMWADMLLCNSDWDKYIVQCGYSPESAEKLREILNKDIIMVDWQYEVEERNIPTSRLLSESGFKVMLAPFDKLITVKACASDVFEHSYFGFMQTTWHRMDKAPCMTAYGSMCSWNVCNAKTDSAIERKMKIYVYNAANLRKLLPPRKYTDAGFVDYELEL